jgi:hypothetical protein
VFIVLCVICVWMRGYCRVIITGGNTNNTEGGGWY